MEEEHKVRLVSRRVSMKTEPVAAVCKSQGLTVSVCVSSGDQQTGPGLSRPIQPEGADHRVGFYYRHYRSYY